MSPLRPTARPPKVSYAAADAPLTQHTLARLQFGMPVGQGADPREGVVPLPLLHGPGAEVWSSDRPVEHGRADGFGFAHDGEVLFAQIHLSAEEAADVERATLHLYVRADALLRQLGYPCWLRVWHYLGGITHGVGDAERYRRFVQGRYRALALKPGFERQLPAATAIGSDGDGLTLYLLAAKSPGLQIENPRQLSAFRYPTDYGPRSPSFSRATLKQWQGEAHLYVSGTASIVGHASCHVDDPMAQLDEIHRNFEALLDQAAGRLGGVPLQPQLLKLYLRQGQPLAQALERVRLRFGTDTPLLVLEGDICRTDLLLEMEGQYRAEIA